MSAHVTHPIGSDPEGWSFQSVKTDLLQLHYYEHGPEDGWPVVLSHGFPYSPFAYRDVVPRLTKAGARVIIPFLRGFGPNRFLSSTTMRSGQQAALATDLIGLLDALQIQKAILAGYDWGGLASCTATTLFPDRVLGLVSYAGYDIIDVVGQQQPCHPSLERVMWYQHLLQSERGKRCLDENRREFCKILWKEWSPTRKFTDATFEDTAASFDNPSFVDVVTHAYRFCFGTEGGDPSLEKYEKLLAQKPTIKVPAITLDGTNDPLKPGGTAHHARMFVARHEHRTIHGCGHNLPQEAPDEMADAILTVHDWVEGKSQA